MHPHLPFFFSALLALTLTGCETMNPAERRVEKNPALFDRLNEMERAAVLRGEVKEGMSRDAVYLAWGSPGRVVSGSREGKEQEKWAYFVAAPVQTTSLSYGAHPAHPFYSSYGTHPQYGYGNSHGPGWGVDTGVDYLPQIGSSVEFIDGRVIAWEKNR